MSILNNKILVFKVLATALFGASCYILGGIIYHAAVFTPTQGVVTDKSSEQGYRKTHTVLTISFTDAKGAPRTFKQSDYPREIGERVKVLYNPSNPLSATLAPVWQDTIVPIVGLLFGGLVLKAMINRRTRIGR